MNYKTESKSILDKHFIYFSWWTSVTGQDCLPIILTSHRMNCTCTIQIPTFTSLKSFRVKKWSHGQSNSSCVVMAVKVFQHKDLWLYACCDIGHSCRKTSFDSRPKPLEDFLPTKAQINIPVCLLSGLLRNKGSIMTKYICHELPIHSSTSMKNSMHAKLTFPRQPICKLWIWFEKSSVRLQFSLQVNEQDLVGLLMSIFGRRSFDWFPNHVFECIQTTYIWRHAFAFC